MSTHFVQEAVESGKKRYS